jgi:hypothetical protein
VTTFQVSPASGPFIDVPSTHQFCHDIEWLAAEGVAAGRSDGTFGPAEPTSRQAMAAFLRRALI